jgi:hypothetical protein
MAGQLMGAGGGDTARCAVCGGEAAGPCARCRTPVCGDCCTLTDGGATTWAICLRCERRGGASLRPAWHGLLGWLGLILLALAAVAGLSMLVAR